MNSKPALDATAAKAGSRSDLAWWQPVLFGALAGGLGWGIRGQYGHETGAMIAGSLVALVLALLFCRDAPSLPVARAVAWATVAIGFGGSMTYGQTVGLTHDPALVGHWDALWWGLLGLALKGGLWIGFAGAFLGMGLGGVRYRAGELLVLMLALLALFFLGCRWLNQPFDPAHRILPQIYFSADWRWLPEAALKPRPEVWGGMLAALIGVVAYAGGYRRDRLALNLALWAVLGGAIGFPLGQTLQAFHAWNLDLFQSGTLARIDSCLNWWNFMETTFGAVMGGTLGWGLWLNRHRLAVAQNTAPVTLAAPLEWALAVVYVGLLVGSEFVELPALSVFADVGLLAGLIPVVAIAGGRWWPYLLTLPITLLPIAGKTVRQLVYEEKAIGFAAGWVVYAIVPVAVAVVLAVVLARRANSGESARRFTRSSLLLATWLYFALNFGFFRYPWPWATWTRRTPNAIVFTVCALGLSWAAWKFGRAGARRAAGASGSLSGVGESPATAPATS